jgi:hypothetical protein
MAKPIKDFISTSIIESELSVPKETTSKVAANAKTASLKASILEILCGNFTMEIY